MKRVEPTLKERAGRMYRRLLLLQRLFQPVTDADELEAAGPDDRARDLAFRAGVRELLDELTEHARLLTSVPFPVSEWRPGDAADDERWRGLTEIERREVLSMISGYENLISWAENATRGPLELAALVTVAGRSDSPTRQARQIDETAEFLKAERARVGRFYQDLNFLNRRVKPE